MLMKLSGIIALLVALFTITACSQEKGKYMKFNKLTPEEERVIVHKGTERPFTGKYVDHKDKGAYVCKRCETPLFTSNDKFESNCGWPSFDDEIEGAVKRVPDPDGIRTEIVCAHCGGHLGHVFEGEGFTPKNTRHCVNSVSLGFVPAEKQDMDKNETEEAIFAGGCFWGVEYYMQQAPGVISTTVGYTGGETENPSYEEVCSKKTGHAEAIKIVYDPEKTTFETLARLFFEIHDPTQVDRQGPDIGEQYRSAIYYRDEDQKKTAQKLITILENKGYDVATKLEKASEFYEAEDYHQDYYTKKGSLPYCHSRIKRF